MTVYALSLPKGGTGKSSTAAELVIALAELGRKVLALDLDQQGNLTHRLGLTDNTPIDYSTADVLRGEANPIDAAVAAPGRSNVFVMAGTRELIAVADAPPADLVTSLKFVSFDFVDDVVIDLQPTAGRMLDTGLAVSDVVIAPVACSVEAFDQLVTLERALVSPTMRRIHPGAEISWIVPTLYDGRRLLDRDIVNTLRERYGDRVTTGTIRESVKVRESYTSGMTVSEYAPTEPVTADIAGVVSEILRGKK